MGKEKTLCNRLVWMDLEMSGLDSERDVIIEICAVVTDLELNVIEEGPEIAIRRPPELFAKMDNWNQEHHSKSGLWDRVVNSTVDERAAEEQIIQFLSKHVGPKDSPLCGNSVWQDRRFIAKYMRKLDDFLHYRLIDVSSLKELARRWYPKVVDEAVKKKEAHRALQDIRDSIDELKYYRAKILLPSLP